MLNERTFFLKLIVQYRDLRTIDAYLDDLILTFFYVLHYSNID